MKALINKIYYIIYHLVGLIIYILCWIVRKVLK